jgi:hypothetical protein
LGDNVVRAFIWVAAYVVFAGSAAAATVPGGPFPHVDGWTITPAAQLGGANGVKACVASGPSDGQAALSLAAEGPQFLLILSAPDFPSEKAAYTVALSFDGKPPIQTVALGDGGDLGIGIGRGDAARTVVASSRVSVMVNGRTHKFSLAHAAAALDAVARCAGEPTLSEQPQQTGQPIGGAPGWTLALTLPGTPGRACMARIPGDQIDTMLLLNNDNDLLLIGGHNDWATWGGDVPLTLAIDGGAPVTLTAGTVNNLILVLVKDLGLVDRLRAAKVLDWTIPSGHVRGNVAGLGAALDAVKKCKAEAVGSL